MASWVRLWLIFAVVTVLFWALRGQAPARQINVLAAPPMPTATPGPAWGNMWVVVGPAAHVEVPRAFAEATNIA